MLYCDNCGKPIKNDANYCSNCGTRISYRKKILKHLDKILFFDAETSGLLDDFDDMNKEDFEFHFPKIVQLGWVIYDIDGNLIKEEEYIVKPNGYEIPIESTYIHGISTNYASNFGISLYSAIKKFYEDVLECDLTVAHNFEFDQKIIGYYLSRNGFDNILGYVPNICTMISTTEFCKIPFADLLEENWNIQNYKYPSLEELYTKLFQRKARLGKFHGALEDSKITAKCFFQLIKNNEIKISKIHDIIFLKDHTGTTYSYIDDLEPIFQYWDIYLFSSLKDFTLPQKKKQIRKKHLAMGVINYYDKITHNVIYQNNLENELITIHDWTDNTILIIINPNQNKITFINNKFLKYLSREEINTIKSSETEIHISDDKINIEEPMFNPTRRLENSNFYIGISLYGFYVTDVWIHLKSLIFRESWDVNVSKGIVIRHLSRLIEYHLENSWGNISYNFHQGSDQPSSIKHTIYDTSNQEIQREFVEYNDSGAIISKSRN